MNILSLSSLPLWDLGKGKGRISTYLPIKGFVERGHNAHYISDSTMQESGMFDGISVNRIKTPFADKRVYLRIIAYPIILMQFLYAGFKYCRKNKPDVVYAHSSDTALPAFLIAKLFKAKYVLRLYGVSYVKTKRFKVSYIFLYTAFGFKADLYILTNDGTAADAVAYSLGAPHEKVYFLKNGVNKKWAEGAINENLRRKMAPNGEQILLSVSRLANWKQVDLILKVFANLIKLNANLRLLIVGDGPEMKYLKNLSADLNIDKHVLFVGGQPQSEINRYMKIADVFISMNALSSLSNPVFEAMVCGLPVIALNRGTTSELIKNGENGILVEDDQLEYLPERINNLFKNNEERKRIAKNGQKTILEQWPSWEERVKNEVDLIEELCIKRSKNIN